MAEKVFVIGLDGGTFTFIHPLIEKGLLPNLAKLMQKGCWGNLTSTIPHITPCAWPSFMTGKNPGKHGIFHFFGNKANDYEGYLVNAEAIRAKTLWQILGEHGKKVGMIDVPVTYPPVPVNGFLISGIPMPSSADIFTYPPELYTELIRECGDFPHEDNIVNLFYSGKIPEALKELYAFTENRLKATLYLMKRYEWDFFMMVFRGTDLVGHYGMRFRNEEYCKLHPEEALRFSQLIPQYYEMIDRHIGTILEMLSKECNVIIMSDHGIGTMKKNFYVNRWLIDEGLMTLKRFHQLTRYKFVPMKYSLRHILLKMRLGFLCGLAPEFLLEKRFLIPRLRGNNHPASRINWAKAKAFSPWISGEGIIRLNVKGELPQGTVELGQEYEDLRNYIISRLYEIRDMETGDKVIEKAFKREELYSGPYLDEAPDILFLMDETGYSARSDIAPGPVLAFNDKDFYGPHHLQGMFIIHGMNVIEGMSLEGARIIDLAPTILYLLGLPIPDDMDGNILMGGIAQSYIQENPIKYFKRDDSDDFNHAPEDVFSTDDAKKIEKQLRELGYM